MFGVFMMIGRTVSAPLRATTLFDIPQVVTNKYMRTLALVKQDSGVPENVDNVLEEDTLNLEASSLTKDDKDFKVYMGSGELTSCDGRVENTVIENWTICMVRGK